MIHRLEAYMNGVPLTSLGKILITNIGHTPAKQTVTTTSLAKLNGDRVLDRRWAQASVSIEFVMDGDSPEERQELCQSIAAWAKGGTLQTSDRYGQQLRCICTDPPSIQNTINRAERIKMTFTAYQQPFWEDELPEGVTLSGTSAEGSIFIPGNVDDMTVVEVEAAPISGTLNELTLTVGNNTITLEELGATTSSPLKIIYIDQMIQCILVGDDSALGKRTRSSADDLLAEIGAQTQVRMTADVAASVRFTARGKWL